MPSERRCCIDGSPRDGEGGWVKRNRRSRPPLLALSAFAGFRFLPDVILLPVRWYLRYSLFPCVLWRSASPCPACSQTTSPCAATRRRVWADIHVPSARHAFDSDELAEACNAVAAHRGAEVVLIAALLPDYPEIAQATWVARRRRPDVGDGLPESFADVLRAVSDFVDPPFGELPARST